MIDVRQPDSYRSISLTSVICNVLERIIVDQVQTFAQINKLFSPCQHGFVAGRSTVSNLASCDSALADMLNMGVAADLIMLHFSRVFDKVDHMILYQKFLVFGLDSSLVTWFADFLSDRKHFVTLGLSLS